MTSGSITSKNLGRFSFGNDTWDVKKGCCVTIAMQPALKKKIRGPKYGKSVARPMPCVSLSCNLKIFVAESRKRQFKFSCKNSVTREVCKRY